MKSGGLSLCPRRDGAVDDEHARRGLRAEVLEQARIVALGRGAIDRGDQIGGGDGGIRAACLVSLRWLTTAHRGS
ncbi:hypothetical protein GCM10009746_07330 [Microbacterium paludicola]